MSKDEVRELLQKEAKRINEQLLEKTRNHFTHDSMNKWAVQLLSYFISYCDQIIEMQKENTKDSIAYIQFSWLRTNIMVRNYKIRIDSYNKDWYLDRVECIGEFDASEIYTILDEYWNKLDGVRKKYVHRLSSADTKLLVLDECVKYNLVIAILVAGAIQLAVQLPVFNEILKDETFCIRVGEFQDKSVEVYPRGQNRSNENESGEGD